MYLNLKIKLIFALVTLVLFAALAVIISPVAAIQLDEEGQLLLLRPQYKVDEDFLACVNDPSQAIRMIVSSSNQSHVYGEKSKFRVDYEYTCAGYTSSDFKIKWTLNGEELAQTTSEIGFKPDQLGANKLVARVTHIEEKISRRVVYEFTVADSADAQQESGSGGTSQSLPPTVSVITPSDKTSLVFAAYQGVCESAGYFGQVVEETLDFCSNIELRAEAVDSNGKELSDEAFEWIIKTSAGEKVASYIGVSGFVDVPLVGVCDTYYKHQVILKVTDSEGLYTYKSVDIKLKTSCN